MTESERQEHHADDHGKDHGDGIAAGNFHGADACDTGYDDGCAGNRGHGTAQGTAQGSHGTHLHDGHTEVCRMGRNRFVECKGRRVAGTGDQAQQEGTYGCADLNDGRVVPAARMIPMISP